MPTAATPEHLLFRRVHNAAYETTKRVETYAGHTCVYTPGTHKKGQVKA
ncbi:hypothetical protein [Nostoc sp.]